MHKQRALAKCVVFTKIPCQSAIWPWAITLPIMALLFAKYRFKDVLIERIVAAKRSFSWVSANS